MYTAYCAGSSLAAVAAAFGVTRQSVFTMFKGRGWPMRPQGPIVRPSVSWGGFMWTQHHDGYYYRTVAPRDSLHRAVWIEAHGVPPDGSDVHHIDEDTSNNELSNLELMTHGDHMRHHHAHEFAPHPCGRCGRDIPRGNEKEHSFQYARRKFCGRSAAACQR